MEELILIKFGGSLITDKGKPYAAKPFVIKRLAREIKICWDKGFRFVVSHGSGSFGHTSAAKYQTAFGIKKKADVFGLAVVQQDAIAINRIVNKIFLEEGLPVLSFAPSSFSFAEKGKLAEIFTGSIIEALKIDALPLVFGDIILDKSQGCCIFSGETTLDNLIKPIIEAGFLIDKVIQCGITDGVYDEKGRTIPIITKKSFLKLEKQISGSSSTDVTGGMAHKIKESLLMAEKGIDSLIINGERQNCISEILLNGVDLGTRITK